MPYIDTTPEIVRFANGISSAAEGYTRQKNVQRQQDQNDAELVQRSREHADQLAAHKQEMEMRQSIYDRATAQDDAATQAYKAMALPKPAPFTNRQAQASSFQGLHPRDQAAVLALAQEHDAADQIALDAEDFMHSGGASDVTPDGKSVPNPELTNMVMSISQRLQSGAMTAKQGQRALDILKGHVIAQRTDATVRAFTLKKIQDEAVEAYGKGASAEGLAPLFHQVEVNGPNQTKDESWQRAWNLALQNKVEVPGYSGKPVVVPSDERDKFEEEVRAAQENAQKQAAAIEILKGELFAAQGKKAIADAESAPVKAEADLIRARTDQIAEGKRKGSVFGNQPKGMTVAESYTQARGNLGTNSDVKAIDAEAKRLRDLSVGKEDSSTDDLPEGVPESKREKFFRDAENAPRGTDPDEFLKMWLKENS